MPGSFFDTNVLLYIASNDTRKAEAAERLIEAGGGRAELHVLDGVGHLLHYERPGECAALLRAWAARGR